MELKLTLTLAFAVSLASSPAFAEEAAAKSGKHAMYTAAKEAAAPKGETKGARTEKKGKTAKAVSRKVKTEETGTEAACPVTGEIFKVTEDTPSVSYKGKNYYFCCPGCDTSFIKDPERYLAKKNEAKGKLYTCPMGCAESDKPGKCPKCGMPMAEKKGK